MKRRVPLWATLIPLLLGIAIWAYLWRGYEARLESDLSKLLPAGTKIEGGGFPYRLQARMQPAELIFEDTALSASAKAAEAIVNRVPWQNDRQVISLRDTNATLLLKPLNGARIWVVAPGAQASLRLEGKRIGRLSIVWDKPELASGLFASPVRAKALEGHFRETPAPEAVAVAPSSASPVFPTQAQLVLNGTEVRFGDGAPLALSFESDFTARAALASYAGWADDGTMEIRAAALSDSTGEVARLTATLVPDGDGYLAIAGTIDTICPASIRAAIAGEPAPIEQRARKPERIAISGRLPGEVTATPRDASKPLPPVRGQEPPCPRLR
ncbi:DUF2125 domain-containing protein [Sandaracinobacter neustonicus]|uniref:DUF2125 domain-containing protein n=1 Tax=Sandaracinobacter neustonicus TaxID=1715348 RepID=A0A501XDR7_9SPHN|nr:DUF2125 domain-containing protein [Sandaracinobacter neustonicus]TPE58599.1 DUF2125 domain-containing protein [Sandaracinobacter neustonicus]